jgi:O-antigen ligase
MHHDHHPRRRLYRNCDALTEGLIYFAIVFGPWAFGTTQDWSIHVMNGVGFMLGLLWLVKLFLRCAKREASIAVRPAPDALRERHFTRLLGAGTICILLYCLVSAWNARAIYQPDQWHFEYRPAISWLPHSYDQAASWSAFWKYLGLAGLFWALRDWLMASSPNEHEPKATDHEPQTTDLKNGSVASSQRSVVSSSTRLPIRLRRLFWVLAINGTVLAFQGLMQRAEGGNRLLWLVEPHINKTADAQFGPYAYRSNAAQYFNLLWPAVLGFWWAGMSSLRRRRAGESFARKNQLAVLLPCVLIMAICPLVTASRGGAIVLVGSLIMAGGILMAAQWRKHWLAKAGVLLGLAGVVTGGALLGWQTLAPRMEQLNEGYAEREGLYLAGHYMAQDNAWFGTGPGTFETMYQLYRRVGTNDWLAQMHNDWLETLITFGRVGATLIFLTLLLVLAHWFRGGGIHGNKYLVMLLWVSLGGCLIHSAFDFPFQIHSVLALFLILCAVLSCLTRNAGSEA